MVVDNHHSVFEPRQPSVRLMQTLTRRSEGSSWSTKPSSHGSSTGKLLKNQGESVGVASHLSTTSVPGIRLEEQYLAMEQLGVLGS